MPKTIYLPEGGITNVKRRSGVAITWTPSAKRLDVGGWYDSGYAGIENTSMTLAEFFDKLGITEKDVKKAFAKNKEVEE